MKYLIPLGVIALVGLTSAAAYVFLPDEFEECCEYIGLLAPDGVSEVPGQEHVDFESAPDDGSIPANLPGLKLHDRVEPFELPDIHGKNQQVDFDKDRLTVVVWVSSFCPTSKIYEARLNTLTADFDGDVEFVGINSSAMESVDELREHFTDGDPDRLRMTVLKDDKNVIADRFGARVSAEAFVFDGKGRLQYRGGIDDARSPDHVSLEYLRTVLDQLVDGDTPEWRYRPAKGCCPIDRLGAETEPAPSPANAVSESD